MNTENISTDQKRRIAIISEVIHCIPTEGIRKFSKELANELELHNETRVYRLGYSLDCLEKKVGIISKFRQMMMIRRTLRQLKPDALIYIPSSPRLTSNLLKFCIWKGGIERRALIMLQPPIGYAPFAKRILSGTALFRQFDISMLQTNLRKFPSASITSGVDVSVFIPANEERKRYLRDQFGIENNRKIVLSVGHLREKRNLSLLMKLARETKARVVFVASEIAGEANDIKRKLRESGILVIDRYIGNIQDIYSIADCYLFPTLRSEAAIGVPLSILEAMSCNVPVVSSRFGILPKIMEGRKGIFFFDDESDAFRLVEDVLSMPKSTDARVTAMEFDWKKIAGRIESALYSENVK